MLLIIFFLLLEFSTAAAAASEFVYPAEFARTLLPVDVGDFGSTVTVLFTGDPQYHYPCTEANTACQQRKRDCTSAHHHHHHHQQQQTGEHNEMSSSSSPLGVPHPFVNEQQLAGRRYLDRDCLHVESEFANEVQRKCIFRLIRTLQQAGQKPAALVINGDLTNFGHHFQLELFKADWLRTMPIPVLVGLGNHDYENNVGDCVANNCAQRMLRWFSMEYAPAIRQTQNAVLMQNMDLHQQRGHLWRTNFFGSLAYRSEMCTIAKGNNNGQLMPFCIHSLQLHNRPDYAAAIEHPTEQWHIRSSFNWLLVQLDRIAAAEKNDSLMNDDDDAKLKSEQQQQRRQIVLINLHNHNAKVAERLRSSMELWHRVHPNAHLDFMVLFAHIHENHSLSIRCLNNRTVPYIYVGSVPNNRFTTIHFHHHHQSEQQTPNAVIFLLQANANSTARIVEMRDFRWTNC